MIDTGIVWFVDDDAGDVAWLAGHPDGNVLNTYRHVTSAYLVLHRASCRTINRPLAAGRTWTHLCGKSCSDDRESLAAWARNQTGTAALRCRHCLKAVDGATSFVPKSPGRVGRVGPRSARRQSPIVTFEGEPVTIVVHPEPYDAVNSPPLIIEGAQWLAETFFLLDPSGAGESS